MIFNEKIIITIHYTKIAELVIAACINWMRSSGCIQTGAIE